MTGSSASPLPETTSGSLHAVSKRRRPHRKSKTGCVDCRRRRVKCDERKPSCQSCVRRHVACIYTVQDQAGGPAVTDASGQSPPTPDRASSRLSHEALPAFQTALPQGQVTGPPTTETSPCSLGHSSLSDASCPRRTASTSTSTSTLRISDLALLHHWTLSTSLSICRESSGADIWQRVFPEVGFEHPFVAHAILSLAALHLAHSRGGRDGPNVAKAAEHHNEALRGFRQAVANITEANSEALFIWSLLNIIYVFGFLTQRCDAAAENSASRISRKELVLGSEWIPMIRGIEAVLCPTHNYLRFGRMQAIMSIGNWYDLEPGPVASQGPDSYLCYTRETWKNSSDAETYDRVLRLLRKSQMFIQQFETMNAATLATWGYNRSWSGPLMFIHFAPDAYLTLLHQRQPPALVLFAHFGALLHGITDYWFVEGLGKEIVEIVGDLLGSYWRPWISWPLDIVGLD